MSPQVLCKESIRVYSVKQHAKIGKLVLFCSIGATATPRGSWEIPLTRVATIHGFK